MTEQLPYTVKRAALPEAIRIICEEPPRRPSSHDRGLRGDLETITLKALEKEPARRYQSAAAFGEDIERYLANQPILARPASVLYQLRKLVVRHRVFFVAAVLLISAVLAVAVTFEHLQTDIRASAESAIEKERLTVAVIENKLAETLHSQGKYDEAEPRYRGALNTFLRLRRDDYAGPCQVNLGKLFMTRPAQEGQDKKRDYENAEEFLLDARDIFRNRRAAERARLREVLVLLQSLYSPQYWDDPDERSKIETELRELDATTPGAEGIREADRPKQ